MYLLSADEIIRNKPRYRQLRLVFFPFPVGENMLHSTSLHVAVLLVHVQSQMFLLNLTTPKVLGSVGNLIKNCSRVFYVNKTEFTKAQRVLVQKRRQKGNSATRAIMRLRCGTCIKLINTCLPS